MISKKWKICQARKEKVKDTSKLYKNEKKSTTFKIQ